MPVPVDIFTSRTTPEEPEVFATALSERVTIFWFDHTVPAPKSGAGPALNVKFDNTKTAGPTASIKLNVSGRRTRFIFAVQSANNIDRFLSVQIADHYKYDVLKENLYFVDAPLLLNGIPIEAFGTLVSFLISVLPGLFKLSRDAGYCAAVANLLDVMKLPTEAAAPVAPASTGLMVSVPTVSGHLKPGPMVILCGPTLIASLATKSIKVSVEAAQPTINFWLESPPLQGERLVVLAGDREPAVIDGSVKPNADLGAWLSVVDAQTRAWAFARLEQASATCDRARGQLEELAVDPSGVAIDVDHVDQVRGGVLISGRVKDPHGLASGLLLEEGSTRVEATFQGPAALGPIEPFVQFIPLEREVFDRSPVSVRVVHRSGRLGPTVRHRPAPFDGRLRSSWFAPMRGETHRMAGDRAARAVVEALQRIERRPARCRCVTFAGGTAAPSLSVISPIPDVLDLLRLRAVRTWLEPGGRHVDFILHWTTCEEDAARLNAIRIVAETFAIPHRALVFAEGTTEAERTRVAISQSSDAALVLPGPVAPTRSAWLAPWLEMVGDADPCVEIVRTVHGAPQHHGASKSASPLDRMRAELRETQTLAIGLGPRALATAREATAPFFTGTALMAHILRRHSSNGEVRRMDGATFRAFGSAAQASDTDAEATVDALLLSILHADTVDPGLSSTVGSDHLPIDDQKPSDAPDTAETVPMRIEEVSAPPDELERGHEHAACPSHRA